MIRRSLVLLNARSRALASLGAQSIDIALEGELPTAFRLFRAGKNATTKGEFLFDDKAAELVMSAVSQHGVDVMIDLEHLSLDQESNAYDPDARGWFKLEVRNGELWAVDVRWTPDGARRLSEKTQRYISPAFMTDDEKRVTEIVNIALVAMPATHGTPALVAANRRPRMKTLKDRKNELAARLSIAKGKLAKLADGEGEAPQGKFAAVMAAKQKAQDALAEIDSAAGDVDAAMAAVDAAMAAVKVFEEAVAAMAGGSSEPAPAPESTSNEPEKQMSDAAKEEKMARALAELQTLRADKARREEDERVQKLAAEMKERGELEAELVRMGRETPASVKMLASMSLGDLRERVKLFRGTPSITALGRIAPPSGEGGQGQVDCGPQTLSEDEVLYLKARHGQMASEGRKLRSIDETLSRYQRHKLQQMRGAKEKGDQSVIAALAKPIDRTVLHIANSSGLIALASTPVTPYESFGASSQAALQSFRLEYNLALASAPAGWAETVGRMLADGSMKTTYPLNFRALKYTEKTAQNAATSQPQNVDIEVKQREFYEGQQIELRRLVKGDFAYIQSWAQLASDLALARVALRNELVTALLEAATTGYWGQSSLLTTGIDGQPFFSASHKVNPFDATKKLRGSATFSNYQSAATPLNATNLTIEKNAAMQVAAPDGRELGIRFDGILYPSSLDQTAENLLKIQDLILDARSSLNSVNNVMGATRNPHFGSGLEQTRGHELAGTDTTANYFLYSREGIARGLVPWVIAEDPTEEVRLFDESSDFYKTTGNIKYESHVFLNAVLLYPHAIRLVKGA